MSNAKKVVLVTGCSEGGIGSHLCDEFARRGCKVYATARRLESIGAFADPTVEKLVLDVLKDEDVERAVATILEREGRIDVLVNNAGMLAIGAMLDVTLEQVRHTFEVNTLSVLRLAKAVIPSMAKRRSGLIINVGSAVGELPTPWNGTYCASKAAMHSISNTLWMECKPYNIDVMCVAPMGVRSHIADNHAQVFGGPPPDSLWASYTRNMLVRMYASQASAMPADVFARKVVSRALPRRGRPPVMYVAGAGTFGFLLLLWLPKAWRLLYVWRLFSRQ